VDLDCIIGLDEQIGKLPASIVRDLLAIGAKPKALASRGRIRYLILKLRAPCWVLRRVRAEHLSWAERR
jgi:hypothetical protein